MSDIYIFFVKFWTVEIEQRVLCYLLSLPFAVL